MKQNEILLNDYILKEDIWELLYDYSTPKQNGKRNMTEENAWYFIDELLKLLGEDN